MKKLILTIALLSLLVIGTSLAQDDTTTSDDGGSTVFFFFGICDTQAVVDLNGFMEQGFDVYVQVFDSVGGAGSPLTPLTRVSVDGDYQVSQVLPYNDGTTLLLGQFASAVFTIARENDSTNIVYTDGIDDVYDTCIEPSFSSTDTFTGGQSTSSTPLVDPVTGEIISTGNVIQTSGIFTPDGGTLNEIFSEPQEAVVQIGARPSDVREEVFDNRVTDPGLIFAECDQFPLADPGIVWDTDNIIIFWSWFAATPELAQQHVNNAQYEVFLSSEYAFRQTFPLVNASQPTLREDGNYYVFYTANLGTGFRSGQYRVDFYLEWDNVIDDGFDLFGPGTVTPFVQSSCTFNVERNPFGIETSQNNPTIPLQQP
ncbi:MAG: hypothetical protein AAF846_23815 [Chloroflexota bacterium]